jgi:Holliday junction resolvase RusA-like endonuclease
VKLTTLPDAGDSLAFTVLGEPRGYVRMTRRGKWTERAKSYHAWMQSVQVSARAAGLKLPLTATYEAPIGIGVGCFFGSRRRPDIDGVLKAVSDALFYGAKGGDKHMVPLTCSYTEGCLEPQVAVLVRRMER